MPMVVARLKHLSTSIKIGELHYMLSLIQLAMNVDSLKAEGELNHRKVSAPMLAKKYAPGVPPSTFKDWVSFGQRLMLLCSGATLYVLPIIAALGMRSEITRRDTSEDDLLSLATALRRVQHGMWLPMVRRAMLPMYHMRRSCGYINSLKLHRHVPMREGEAPKVESFGFHDISTSDRIFDSVRTHFPVLAQRSSEWEATSSSLWKPLEDPEQVQLPLMVTVKTPLKFQKMPCPVNKRNRNQWTETERERAVLASRATSIKDLKAKASYICLLIRDSRQALRLEDSTGKLLSLLFTVPAEYRQVLSDAIQHIYTAMPGALFKDEDSSRKFFQYYACHYSWYARYAEKVVLLLLYLH
ncbi:hypothetical protein R3P38DRAFT_2527335 [Favolaschia claudopus]|uniref:Uncharacterized protein n=1 Tax=Favolaschia claudopus TaxID=2862362 RepID=A0AAW0BNU3_9AGAR